MEKCKVSIIVPVYNCKKALNRCLDSLVNQTLSEIEILLIDDGSSDGSSEICQDYSNRYTNCKYYYQCNGGVSKARNKGIEEATGEYIIFSDSDDYYEINAAELLYKSAISRQAEIVSGGILKHFIDHDELQPCKEYIAKNKEIDYIIVQMTENFAINQVWGKIYLTRKIIENQIYFDENLDCGEDLEWMSRMLGVTKCLAGIPNIVYNYNIFENMTLSKEFSPIYFERIDKSFVSLERLYKSRGIYTQYEHILLMRQDNNIWCGFQSINERRYGLTFSDKIKYVKRGMDSKCFRKYRRREVHYLSKLQDTILRINNPYVLVIVLIIISYIRGWMKSE